ncbi:phenoloxidase-activating factor 2-like [Anopheles coustani]|uniref:phenoloxidase-activating factor 2-like n=1 Tax=Anopheles coustani TaxID=139045 RepID=UPI002657ACCF|nr:phenoloxidase-activating factor 2-like [Anopheles coustani]
MKLNRQLQIFLLLVLHYRATSQTSVVTAVDDQYCFTDTGDHGLCVYQYQCLDGRINYYGETMIDLRRAGDDCGEYLMVCCTDGNNSDQADEVKNVRTTTPTNEFATSAKGSVMSTTESSLYEGEGNDVEETTDPMIVDPDGDGTSRESTKGNPQVESTTESAKNEGRFSTPATSGKGGDATVRPPVVTSTESSLHKGQDRTPGKPEHQATTGKGGNVTVSPPPVSTQRIPTIKGTSTTKRPIQPPPLNIPEYNVEGCGHRNPNGVVFSILNNVHSESEYGEYPWVVAIFVPNETTSELQYRCGGALIDQAAVLTTASCVYQYRSKSSQLVVRLGEWDMSTQREPIPHVDSEAENVHIHPEYSVTTKVNDIAIVILRETMVMNHMIGVICLPQVKDVPMRGDLIGAGWGDAPLFVTPKKFPQTILKKAHLHRMSKKECQEKLRKLTNPNFQLHESFICAQATDTEMLPCRGDSGSPYVVEVSGGSERYYLVGLSSWGYDCNRQNTPTVMTNVAYHRDWIDKVIKQENFNPWTYTYELEESKENK